MKTIPIIIVFITSFFITELFAQEDKIPVPSISEEDAVRANI